MDTITTGDAARELGTSVPRVHRAIHRLGLLPDRTAGGHLRLGADDLDALRRALRCREPAAGLSWHESLALAVLSRHPLGLVSARALSRRAGISPTTASRVLRRLQDQGYVERTEQVVLEGRARKVAVWQVRYASTAWLGAAPAIGGIEVDEPRPRERATRIPRRLAHLFWNVPRPSEIDLATDAVTVAHRILTSHDPSALAWAADHLPPDALRRAARFRDVDERGAALARNLARQ